MDTSKALKIAVQAVDREIQRYAVDGNLYEMAGAKHQTAVNAAKKREELKAAKVILISLMLGRSEPTPQQLTLKAADDELESG